MRCTRSSENETKGKDDEPQTKRTAAAALPAALPGNLLSACETLLQLEGALNPKIADVLRPRADALKLALFGKTIQ